MKFLSLYSGIGGFDWGVMLAGHECIGYVEFDKFAHQSYQILHDPEERMWHRSNVKYVSNRSIRKFGRKRGPIQLIVAGFPCQSFSIAGKREGFADATRGTLFFEIVRFASILRPQCLLLENVEGLLNHNKGKTFEIVLATLDELGYDCEWQVLNSAAYVPQNRERIFIVGHLGGIGTRKVFPFGRENNKAIEVIGRLALPGKDQWNRVYGTGGVAPALSTMQGGRQEPKILDDQGRATKKNKLSDVSPTLRAQTHGNEPKVVVTGHLESDSGGHKPRIREHITPPLRAEGGGDKPGIWVSERIAGWVENDDKIFAYQGDTKRSTVQESVIIKPEGRTDAITVGHTPKTLQGYHIRKLTPLECFRLQSYPDEWYVKLKLFRHPELIPLIDMNRNDITEQVSALIGKHHPLYPDQMTQVKEGISDSQLYKMAGNGVTSQVAYEIGIRI